jgi:hypothetical protein
MGKNLNRVRLYDPDGGFLSTMNMSEAQHMLDFGKARQVSTEGERPVRIRLNPSQRGVRDNRDAFPRTLPGAGKVQQMAGSIDAQRKQDFHLTREGWRDGPARDARQREAAEKAEEDFMKNASVKKP